ncbi:MAG: hypothetical protein LC637_04125 [Xanthomonadaceae bacterium]|nr:hypothetical protein [Xanthomonadaceae bacterium]
MFNYQFSRLERWWILGLRLAWQYRRRPRAIARLIDRIFDQAGLEPCGNHMVGLLTSLEHEGASHLYLERFDQPGLTGDERDLLLGLNACYRDDLLAAENALSALLPPDHGDAPLRILQTIARPKSRRPQADAPHDSFSNQLMPVH